MLATPVSLPLSAPEPTVADLIRRYDGRAPRYTSYPTAVQFTALDSEQWLNAWQASRGDLSLYLHIPYCQHLCYYCGCFKEHGKPGDLGQALVASLLSEARLYRQRMPARRVTQVHLGGGTPSFLTLEQMQRLFAGLRQLWSLEPEAGDFSIELDPRVVDASYLQGLRALGFNRISFGVQDFNLATQKAIHRQQSLAIVAEMTVAARAVGFASISYDLIYGLPKQSPESFAQTIAQVKLLNPDRVAMYSYAHLPERFQAQQRIQEQDLPSAEDKLQMLLQASQQLQAAGYTHIGMDHFAKPKDPLVQAQQAGHLQRNFQGYSTQARLDILALGPSAIGQVAGLFGQNVKDTGEYQQRLQRQQLPVSLGYQCHAEDERRAWVIQTLACAQPVTFAEYQQRFKREFRVDYGGVWPQLQQMQTDGLLQLSDNDLRVTDPGRYLLRAICVLFDGYFQASTQARHSRIV